MYLSLKKNESILQLMWYNVWRKITFWMKFYCETRTIFAMLNKYLSAFRSSLNLLLDVIWNECGNQISPNNWLNLTSLLLQKALLIFPLYLWYCICRSKSSISKILNENIEYYVIILCHCWPITFPSL